jgi:hypothetical protein
MSDFARVSLGKAHAIYRTNRDFLNLHPQYIILYAQEASQDPRLFSRVDVKKALREINAIRIDFLPCIEINGCQPEKAIPHLDKSRPVLVNGFFGELNIRDFVEDLQIKGFNAHISLEGTCKYA